MTINSFIPVRAIDFFDEAAMKVLRPGKVYLPDLGECPHELKEVVCEAWGKNFVFTSDYVKMVWRYLASKRWRIVDATNHEYRVDAIAVRADGNVVPMITTRVTNADAIILVGARGTSCVSCLEKVDPTTGEIVTKIPDMNLYERIAKANERNIKNGKLGRVAIAIIPVRNDNVTSSVTNMSISDAFKAIANGIIDQAAGQ